jgi:hypothetical protein
VAFAHYDHFSANSLALSQTAAGATRLQAAAGQNIAQAQLLSRDIITRLIGSQLVPGIATLGAEFGLDAASIGSIGADVTGFASRNAQFAGAGPFSLLVPAVEKLLQAAGMISGAANKLDAASARLGNTTPQARAAAAGASQ